MHALRGARAAASIGCRRMRNVLDQFLGLPDDGGIRGSASDGAELSSPLAGSKASSALSCRGKVRAPVVPIIPEIVQDAS